ncbi:FAD-dependent oxidoreductase [Phyllobacterium brassicacearum]|uniref:FAD-dependent oxidoreductase n=1 Tax=Phyllobacterium brassicacearum TaxID=314235 RepID=UPI001FE01AE8|nr:FAD-dependent oxidoreductase [Phyllobacterium brassicacearum]
MDVLVIGGRPSGISAAIAAARMGVRVMMIERYGFLGGNLTAGLTATGWPNRRLYSFAFRTSTMQPSRITSGLIPTIIDHMHP